MLEAPFEQFLPWLFPRFLGCVYLLAFSSLLVQVPGLYGSGGILPIASYLAGFSTFPLSQPDRSSSPISGTPSCWRWAS